MNPLSPVRFRQGCAHRDRVVRNMLACEPGMADPLGVGRFTCARSVTRLAIASLFLRPGMLKAGPTLSLARVPAIPRNFHFSAILVAINCPAITTRTRGSISCARPSAFWPFSPFLWPAVCRTLHRAAWPVPSSVRLSPMRPTRILLRAQHLAALRAMPAARSTSDRPATDAFAAPLRGKDGMTTAPLREHTTEPRAIRASRADGLFVFAPWGRGAAKEGRRCSRRS